MAQNFKIDNLQKRLYSNVILFEMLFSLARYNKNDNKNDNENRFKSLN